MTTDSTNPSIAKRVVRHKWEGEKYSRADGNFTKWSDRLEDLLILNGLYNYVFDPPSPPDKTTEPRAYSNWVLNDKIAITFIKTALDDVEHRALVTNKGAKYCYDDLKSRAQREGPIKQIGLLRDSLSTFCSTGESLPTTANCIVDIVRRAFDIGNITMDLFTCTALLNSLNDPAFEALQNSVSTYIANSTKENPCKPSEIILLMENAQNIINSKANSVIPATALTAKSNSKHCNDRDRGPDLPGHNHPAGAACCDNCRSLGRPCRGHTKPFCVQKGGGMQGKSISEARAAAREGSRPKTEAKVFVAVTGADGKTWYVDQSSLEQPSSPLPAAPDVNAFAGLAHRGSSTEDWEYSGFMASIDGDCASVDWNEYTTDDDSKVLVADISPLPQKSNENDLSRLPFFVDSGATVHISPSRGDFTMLCPISPKTVKGLGGSSVAAIGMGNVRLCIDKDSHITLNDVLYIPNATVRLVSVSALTSTSNVEAVFDNIGVRILDKASRAIITQGPLSPKQRLYSLRLYSPATERVFAAMDIKTWHRRLGHANYQTIRDMATAGLVPGMPSTFSSLPPACHSCILGKQTKNPVPKTREEGRRATRKLEVVWVDLTGPQAVLSRNGYSYVMNIIDDFTSNHWTILLKQKNDAIVHLRAWQIARETETGTKLGKYRTGHDGELDGHEMEKWLLAQGTERQYGAPYTSQHIGRVEHMHRTLMGKAQAMRIATGCPPNTWVVNCRGHPWVPRQ